MRALLAVPGLCGVLFGLATDAAPGVEIVGLALLLAAIIAWLLWPDLQDGLRRSLGEGE